MNHTANGRKAATTMLLLMAVGLLLSACGSSSKSSSSSAASTPAASTEASPTETSSTASTPEVSARTRATVEDRLAGFRACMKKYGINLPVTKIGERFKQPVGVSDAKYAVGLGKCRGELGSIPTPPVKRLPKVTSAERQKLINYAECLRHQGIQLPAPTQARPLFYPKSVNLASAQFKAAQLKCVPVLVKKAG
ncbi:MAG: hypothetical protein QOI03_677 [Solirubrobacteraceae bacterium]|jgi:hypothetical protein|nr:hypothetical protein [Solirubrobacteraceae bacterium]